MVTFAKFISFWFLFKMLKISKIHNSSQFSLILNISGVLGQFKAVICKNKKIDSFLLVHILFIALCYVLKIDTVVYPCQEIKISKWWPSLKDSRLSRMKKLLFGLHLLPNYMDQVIPGIKDTWAVCLTQKIKSQSRGLVANGIFGWLQRRTFLSRCDYLLGFSYNSSSNLSNSAGFCKSLWISVPLLVQVAYFRGCCALAEVWSKINFRILSFPVLVQWSIKITSMIQGCF